MRARVDLLQTPNSEGSRLFDEPVHPPLGLLQLAAVLQQAGHECRVVDLRLHRRPEQTLARAWARRRPQVIGVSTPTICADRAEELVRFCKVTLPDVPVVLGGPHVIAYGPSLADTSGADVLVRGEGEPVISTLVEALAAGEALPDLPGVIGTGGEGPTREDKAVQEDLDEVPFPAWDQADLGAYARFRATGFVPPRRYATLMGSRGCPHRCVYCQKLFGRRRRAKSPTRLVDELEHLVVEHGVRSIEIVDDLFGLDRARLVDIGRQIRQRELDLELWFSTNGLRPDHLDREKLDLLREAGTRMISFPIDSGSERIQRLMERDLDLDRAQRMITHADSLDILCGGLFMLGFPTETRDEMLRTAEFAIRSDLHLATFLTVTAYEGSPMTERYPYHSPSHLKWVNNDFGTAIFEGVSLATVNEVRRLAYGRFLSRPRRLVRLLQLYPSPAALPRGAVSLAARTARRSVLGSSLVQRLRRARSSR